VATKLCLYVMRVFFSRRYDRKKDANRDLADRTEYTLPNLTDEAKRTVLRMINPSPARELK
jgi:hypothetical protein